MARRITVTVAIAAIVAGAALGCSRNTPGQALPEKAQALPAPGHPSGPGAYDFVKMDRFGRRKGPVYFAHALHADLVGLDGKVIACAYCHYEQCGPPRRCGECHLGRRGRAPGQPRLPST